MTKEQILLLVRRMVTLLLLSVMCHCTPDTVVTVSVENLNMRTDVVSLAVKVSHESEDQVLTFPQNLSQFAVQFPPGTTGPASLEA